MKEQELIDAMDRLADKLDSLSGSVGRGSQTGGTKHTVPGSKKGGSENKAQKENTAALEKNTKSIQAQRFQTDEEIKASKKAIDAQEELTEEQKKSKRAQERTREAIEDFGGSLVSENANLSGAFKSLGGSLKGTGTAFGATIGWMAAGVGYAIAGLQEFAKSAGDMGAFADLSKFSVGSVTSMKLMSGLGGAFMKVIEESDGTFRAFGATSQEAAENLSNLSRGLKYGSGYLNKTLKDSLGTDLVKSVDRAARAARSMGMTDEEQAKLTGQLAVTAAMGATSEAHAKKILIEQYTKTVDTTKTLNSAFGITKTAALAAADAFRKSDSGAYAAREGMTADAAGFATLMQNAIGLDADKANRIGLAVSRGQEGEASSVIGNGPEGYLQQQFLNLAMEAKRNTDGSMESVAAYIKANSSRVESIIKEGSANAVYNPELAKPGAALARFKAKMDSAKPNEPDVNNSETDNIMAMNSLTAALESLRDTILGLTSGIASLVGSLGTIAVMALGAGAIGATGLLSKVGDMIGGGLSKAGGWAKNTKVGSWAAGKMSSAGSAGSGMMDKLSGAASKGMEGFGEMLGKLGENKTVKGAATLALLGSALALTATGLKTFNEVNWSSFVKGTIALGGLIGMARLVGEATTGMLKGAAVIAVLGAAMWVAGKGFKEFNDLDWESMAKGVVALGAFGVVAAAMGTFLVPILLGSAAIAGLGVALGVFGAGAYLAAQAADVFAGALKKIGDVDGVNLIAVGAGLAAIGAGAVVFAAGMVAATATSLVTGLMSLFGAKSPIERIMELVPVADKISMIGEGMFKFGSSIGLINDNLQALDLNALAKFKDALVEISNIDIPSLDGLSIPQISTDGITGTPQQGNSLSNLLNGNSAITPEIIGQVMSYLSSIENDLAAIRGNTRQSGYDSPVRLS